MRLVCTLEDRDLTKRFSDYLTSQGIENEVDGKLNSDWGSDNYGLAQFHIWVIDEDQADKAYQIYTDFSNHPNESRFDLNKDTLTATESPQETPLIFPPKLGFKKNQRTIKKTKAPITTFLLILCCLVFMWDSLKSPVYYSKDSKIGVTPLYASPVKKLLLYDYPKAYAILDELTEKYGIDALKDVQTLPPDGFTLYQQLNKSPYWVGYYDKILDDYHQGTEESIQVKKFEKIREGEIWRVFTPIFLHGDIFHLLFNMLWLFVLGRQMETHLAGFRYLLFIAITAAGTNTAQYLMSGSGFLGISGVVCAMLAFIWRRQQVAPWEGYQLHKSTYIFMLVYIFGMLALQSFAFLIELSTGSTISTYIANTAHVIGICMGYLLAFVPFFSYARWVK